jgi:transposase
MPQLTPKQKHDILTLYSSNDSNYTFESLAHQYNIKGGKNVIWRWYQQWNGTPQSLERKKGSGRPTLLSSQQVNDYIRTPIRNKNRSFKPIHYTQLHSSIQQKTGKQISLRTVQRCGKEKLGVQQKRTKKRTAQECKQT